MATLLHDADDISTEEMLVICLYGWSSVENDTTLLTLLTIHGTYGPSSI
jgi:hypothetical protein